MSVDAASQGFRIRNAVLIGAGAGLLWCAFSVLSSGSSASAADTPPDRGGPLGVVSQTVSTVGQVTDGVVGTVDRTLDAVADVVGSPDPDPAPAPAQHGSDAAPAPSGDVVRDTTHAVSDTLHATADSVTGTVSQTVEGVTQPLSDLVGAGVVSSIAGPVLDTVTGLSIVGSVVAATPVPPLVDGVASGVDGVLGAVVGQPGSLDPTVPVIPGAGQPLAGVPGSPSLTATGVVAAVRGAPASGVLARDGTPRTAGSAFGAPASGAPPAAPAQDPPGPHGLPADVPAPPPGGAHGSSGGPTSAALVSGVRVPLPAAGAVAGERHADALPASPVYPTDVSPD